MSRTLLIAATLASTLGAAAPALADRDGWGGPGYSGRYQAPGDQAWRPDPHRWADYRPDYRHRRLPPDAVAQQLRYQNFRRVGNFDRYGDIYRFDARDPRGRPVRVSVDAYSGRIIDVRRR
jgi:hypothetical protein